MDDKVATQHGGQDGSHRADVCVIGAGFVGLCNALLLARRGLSVILLDELTQRQRESYKVGESLLVFPVPFLRALGLGSLLDQSFHKKGYWMAYGLEGRKDFGPEVSEWAFHANFPDRWRQSIGNPRLVDSMVGDWQLVRPEFEAAMRERARETPGVAFLERGLADDITIGENGSDHVLRWRSRDGSATGEIRSRWVVDCSGRSRFLARRFGHGINLDEGFRTSAVWAQFSGCTDEDFGSVWRHTMPDGKIAQRDLSTVHLWGDGYWIWLIRLTDDRISVGVSVDRDRLPERNLRTLFWDIIRRYPLLEFLQPDNMLELSAYRDIQHISDTYVSPRRYALSGDAASIIDALYSQGLSLSLSTSWHAANIIQRDVQQGGLDTAYISRVNRTAKADWLLMRSTVRRKYGPAIRDGRFFLLDHMLDYLVIAGGLLGRYRISRWLIETGDVSATADGSPRHRGLHRLLTRKLFLTRGVPLPGLSPEQVVALLDRTREGLARRARWRLEHGAQVPPMTAVVRFDGSLPAVWRLPYLRLKERWDLSPRSIKEPAFVRPRGTETTPTLLLVARAAMVTAIGFGVLYDAAETGVQRARHAVRERLGRRRPRHAPATTQAPPRPTTAGGKEAETAAEADAQAPATPRRPR